MRLLFLLLLSMSLAACFPHHVPQPPTPPKPAAVTARYLPADWAALPAWPGDQLADSWPAFLNTCKRLASKAGWKDICAEAVLLTPQDQTTIQAFFQRRFQPWRIEASTGAKTGLITGYYEPLLKGSLQPKAGSVPFYAVPDDLLTVDLTTLFPDLKGKRVRGRLQGKSVVPYWTRAEVASGKLEANTKVLAWADDAVEAFFMEVQGSGRITLEDGSIIRLGYADQNGHPYRSIGKWLVEQGELTMDKASMQSIQAWAKAHPERLQEMLNANPSVVFFRILADATGGPIGALNVPLVAQASVAVDPKFVPLGAPLYLATTRPNDSQPMNRMVHAQDTGGAIAGPIRADFFWGYGQQAGEMAGKMKQQGQIWLLWPKDMPLPNSN